MRHFLLSSDNQEIETAPRLSAATFAGHVLTGVRTVDAAQAPALRAKLAQGLRRVAVPQDAAGRAAFIAKWVQRHQRRLSAGLPASVLVLAMGSAAAAQDGLTDLATVDGVAEVELRADGSVKVTLDNGSTVVLPQQSVSVGADGTILISASALDSLTAIIANAGPEMGVVGGGLAVAGLGLAIGGGSGGGAVTGGGGDGTDTGGGGVAPVLSSNGRVIDGYIANATVFRDLNANGILDTGEPNVTTDATGNFAGLEGTGGVIVAFGGTDISTGKLFTGQLTAPGDATVVTPLTTLVQALVQQGGGSVTAEQAAQQVADAFELTDFDINKDDPVGTDNLAALKAGAQVAAIISVAAAGAGEGGEAAASEAAAQSLATAITNRNVEETGNPLTGDAITAALQAAAGDGADVTDKATALNTAVAFIEDARNVDSVEQAQTVVQGELVDAVRNETPIPDAEAIGTAIEAAAPLRPTLFTKLPDVINAQDAADFSLTLSGTGRNDTSINIQLGDVTITGAATVEEGSWTYILTELPSDGVEKILVTATETVGDLSVTSLPASFQPTITIDTTIPATPIVALAEDTGTVAGETSNGQVNVSGLEDGSTREYAVNDGAWTAFEGDSFLLEGEGVFSIVVRQTDAAGNTSAESATLQVTVDATAPDAPTLEGLEAGDVINNAAAREGVTVSGAVEQGATVTLQIGEARFSLTDGEGEDSLDGMYSFALSADQLPDDGDYTVEVTATDGAGNTSVAQTVDIKIDTTAPAAPVIALANDTGLLAGFTQDGTVVLSNLEEGARAEYSVNGGDWIEIEGNSFTLMGDDFYPITVRQTDADGNVSQESEPLFFQLDTVAPVVWRVNEIGTENVINAAAAAEGVTISGELNGGTRVTLTLGEEVFTLNDADGDDSLEGFSFTLSAEDLPEDGEYTVNLQITDAAGNETSGEFGTVTIDTAAPAAPVIAAVGVDDVIGLEASLVSVTGTAEVGAIVAVTLNGETEEAMASDGTFSISFERPALTGDYTITATATDAAGNTGPEGSRDITVDLTVPPSAAQLIGSAMTLAEMEAALTAFAAEQEELTIPNGMLSDLAGDALIYRSGQYSFAFSGTVLGVDGAPEGVALNDTFGGTINFQLPLGDFTDQLADATDPVAVFQFQQDGISGNVLNGVTLANLRFSQPSLRMDIETLDDLPPDAFLDALIGQEGREQLAGATTVTNLQIWLSGVTSGTQDPLTGEFSGLTGSEISINFIRVGAVGLESFFDDPEANILREISIATYVDGVETGYASARVDTLSVSFAPGIGYAADDLVAGFNALIDLRTAIDTAVENANNGALTVEDVLAIANELESEFLPFAPPFLAGEALSQDAVNRLIEFRESSPEDQQATVEEINASRAEFSNLTDLVASGGDETWGGPDGATVVEFIPGANGPDATEIFINGETVDLLALVETALAAPDTATIEILGVDDRPGIVLDDGRVVIKLFVEVPSSPTGEDWLLILTPEGAVDAYYRGGFSEGEAGFLSFDDTFGDAQGIVFSVINASSTLDGLVQGSEPYFTTYRLSLGDLQSLADTEGLINGRLDLADMVDNAEVLLMVNGLNGPVLGVDEFVLPIAYGIEVDPFGNPEAYVVAGVGTLDFTIPDNAFVVERTILFGQTGAPLELPGRITELTTVMDGDEIFGIKIAMTLNLEPAGVGPITQDTVFVYGIADDEITKVQTTGTSSTDVLLGFGSNDLIIPLGAPNIEGGEDVIRLPFEEGEAGKETIVIRLSDVEADAGVAVFGFNTAEDEISLLDPSLSPGTTFTVTAVTFDQFAARPVGAEGQIELFAVADDNSSLLFITNGAESAQVAWFDNVTNTDLATTNVTLFNPDMLLETLPT